jgi:SpoVK/Ycf46/Vps4 family AAA+-type ATPase
MASADQLKALIKCHAEGDDERFYAVAMQVAAQEARNGHGRFAIELRELIDRAKMRAAEHRGPHARPVPLVRPRGELAGLLVASYPTTRMANMVLDGTVKSRLERVIHEQRQKSRLEEHGFSPVRKLLLLGPPGTGKTMTAAALAGELGLPLFTIQLDGLITKFMGETAAKLRVIFEAISVTPAVYLFDEFDALGSERGAKNDVGEIRRVLNSFLQFLEQDQSGSVIVAATNHPALLDRALFRRFDNVIEYALPTPDVAEAVMRTRLALLDVSNVNWSEVGRASTGMSHADVVRASEQAAKNAILAHTTVVQTDAILAAIRERWPSQR